MTIKEGDMLPAADLLLAGKDGLGTVSTSSLTGKIAIFGLPGAFTGTCSTQHLPSFSKNVAAFREKGVERIICIAVNDPFVCQAWSDNTGAAEAGVEILSDASGALTKAMGLEFDAPQYGLFGRCQRFAAIVEDGKVTALNLEEKAGAFDLTSGEKLLARL